MRGEHESAALVEAVAGAKTLAEYEREAIAIVEAAVGFDVAMYRRSDGVLTHGLDPSIERACRPHWGTFRSEIAPVFQAALQQRGVAVDVDVLSDRRLQRLEYYQRLMRPHQGRATAVLCMTRQGQLIATLSMGRVGRPFNAAELDQLRSLVRTLSVCDTAAAAPRVTTSLNAVSP